MIDLHTHSTASDGRDSPAAVMQAAAEAGLTVVALTDHDTTAGWDEAAAAAMRSGMALVRGTEISICIDGVSVHLLSYLHDPTHPELVELLERTRDSRVGRAQRMAALLAEDYPITWEDVQAQAQPDSTLGRPHLADALIAAGVVASRDEAFATMLRPGSRYYVFYGAPTTMEAVGIVLAAGGVPVLAHPGAVQRGRTIDEARIEELAAAGVAGLEIDHRDHCPKTREQLRALATRLGLLVTGSSDYHGAG
ncbi:MAG: PHP domain-containing protein, partial [Promicromonosporaceae bacterium]|nr:PHP domain-containing protein [Promicromonosporaceae bacterium]